MLHGGGQCRGGQVHTLLAFVEVMGAFHVDASPVASPLADLTLATRPHQMRPAPQQMPAGTGTPPPGWAQGPWRGTPLASIWVAAYPFLSRAATAHSCAHTRIHTRLHVYTAAQAHSARWWAALARSACARTVERAGAHAHFWAQEVVLHARGVPNDEGSPLRPKSVNSTALQRSCRPCFPAVVCMQTCQL